MKETMIGILKYILKKLILALLIFIAVATFIIYADETLLKWVFGAVIIGGPLLLIWWIRFKFRVIITDWIISIFERL